jgi:outer membrane protein OmpA-like peptidoglycan-associated protein
MQHCYAGKVALMLCLVILIGCSSSKKEENNTSPANSVKAPLEKQEPPKADTSSIAKPVETKPEPVKKVEPAVKKAEPVVVQKTEPAKPVTKEPVKTKEPEPKTTPAKEVVTETPKTEVVVTKPAEEPVKKEPIKPVTEKKDTATTKKPEVAKKPKGKPYYFKVIRKEDGKEILGELQLQEALGATQYQLVKSGELIYLEAPRNKRGSYNIVALLPGYKEKSLIFLYNNPPIEIGPQNEEIITLVVDKAKTGDYVDFNNVHFFRNASILRPASKNELDQLVILLKENPRYKIRIHGHCNGTQDRESYLMGTSTDFFAMDPKTNKKTTISAKDLSEARAESVKSYLVKQGIDPERIATKAEGGKIPIYPESGTLAQYNDRIEVEFTKH